MPPALPWVRPPRPEFFDELAEFYCTGVLRGFGVEDLRRSPLLLQWLEHELRYGQRQREYARQWFAHVAGEEVHLTPEQHVRPRALRLGNEPRVPVPGEERRDLLFLN